MSEFTKGIREYYDATAVEWAELWYQNELLLPLLTKFVGLLPTNPRVLDTGCGAGYESMRLNNLKAEVVGVDISEESIKIARIKNPSCNFHIMDCLHLEDTLGYFDGITAIALLVHIKDCDLQNIFENFKKVIKPGGYLFIALVEGNGIDEGRSYIEKNGEKYNRTFYLHQLDRLVKVARASGFHYHDEWFLNEPANGWRFYIFIYK